MWLNGKLSNTHFYLHSAQWQKPCNGATLQPVLAWEGSSLSYPSDPDEVPGFNYQAQLGRSWMVSLKDGGCWVELHSMYEVHLPAWLFWWVSSWGEQSPLLGEGAASNRAGGGSPWGVSTVLPGELGSSWVGATLLGSCVAWECCSRSCAPW